jgi:poly(3-hydroxybutyrate) depolymerase
LPRRAAWSPGAADRLRRPPGVHDLLAVLAGDEHDGSNARSTPRRLVARFAYRRWDGGRRVELLRVTGTDHGWPGAGPPLPDHNPSGLSATTEVLRFVASIRHRAG